MQPGTLYVVATPIGNLEDITLRALDTLRSVSLIACEDTRRTRVLLQRHGIAGRLVPFHKFNERNAAAGLVRRLLEGESIALVSDGGTPAVSDPGYRLVRDALDAGASVTPIPGPSAFVAAVSASGLPSECVTFRGFLPHRAAQRRRVLESIRDEQATQVFYESPHRIVASLQDLCGVFGERQAAVARELTKRFETWYRGTLPDVARHVAEGSTRGEFCIVVEGASARPGRSRKGRRIGSLDPGREDHAGRMGEPDLTGELAAGPGRQDSPESSEVAPVAGSRRTELRRRYEEALASGLDRREALRRAARECALSRKEAYTLLRTI